MFAFFLPKALDERLHGVERGMVRPVKFFGDRLDIEGVIVPFLDGEWRECEQVRADGFEVQLCNHLRSRSHLLVRPDCHTPEELSLFFLFGHLHVEEVPISLRFIGEDEETVRVVFQKAGRNDALVGKGESILGKPGVEDLEIALCATSGQQHRVVGKHG